MPPRDSPPRILEIKSGLGIVCTGSLELPSYAAVNDGNRASRRCASELVTTTSTTKRGDDITCNPCERQLMLLLRLLL